MAAPRNRRHILVLKDPWVERYTPHRRSFPQTVIPPENRSRHGAILKVALQEAVTASRNRRQQTGISVHGAEPGLYVEFRSQPSTPLNIGSLEDRRKGIEVVSVTETVEAPEGEAFQRATVFIPDGQVGHFLRRFEKYASSEPKKRGERRHEDMIDRIAGLRLATFRALWTDDDSAYPAEDRATWWEIWLRRQDGRELARIHEFADAMQLRVGARRLEFDDRTIVLMQGSASQLSASIDILNDIAEVRCPKETAGFFADLSPGEQAPWVEELLRRTTPPPDHTSAVCILDTGVNCGHPLLASAIAPTDLLSVDDAWGSDDHHGHGTEMAGLVLYGDLTPLLEGSLPVMLRHRLESVKILPPPSFLPNEPFLYGALTAAAAATAEIHAPNRARCFSMAVTAMDNRDRGQPTSWSAAIDALAAGRSFDATKQGLVYFEPPGDAFRRLFIVSAGNVPAPEVQHLDRSDLEPVHDPAQAWNALTVGAFTQLDVLRDPELLGWGPLARKGDLSPWSTTSLGFATPWPIKPDVVAEGGNLAREGTGPALSSVPDLSLLTTHYRPLDKLLVPCWATSAACAQVAGICGRIAADYREFWPETIRALVVHSAEWTPAMRAHLQKPDGRRARSRLARRYGFGVPDLDRALRSANDALTLVVQGVIRPFERGSMREMHLHELPWPGDILAALGESPVQLRVTLSYFVEPNPARRGWQKRHRYQSHALRYEVRAATESLDEFRKRLNLRALEEEEERPAASTDAGWFFGSQSRNRGSIHSDTWVGMAADLAERGVIGIYPVSGWWKEQPKRDRSDSGARYSLVVSIETKAEAVDIWTPVATEVGIPISTDTW